MITLTVSGRLQWQQMIYRGVIQNYSWLRIEVIYTRSGAHDA